MVELGDAASIFSHVGYSNMLGPMSGEQRKGIETTLINEVYQKMDKSKCVAAINWLMSGRTNTWSEQQIIEILRTTSWSAFNDIVGEIRVFRFNLNLTGSRQTQFDSWMSEADK